MNYSRPTNSTIIMQVAQLVSKRSTCTRAQVGAVLADDNGRILATGYNGSPSGYHHCTDTGCDLDSDGHCTLALHAEENCIFQCAIHGVSTVGLNLFTTHRPCQRCVDRLWQVGVRKIYFTRTYGELPAYPSGMRVTQYSPPEE